VRRIGSTKTPGYRVYSFVMAKNSQFSLVPIGRGSLAVAKELAISTRFGAIEGVSGFAKPARITKISVKAITIR
jgi:hypothetical protein